MNQQTSWQSGLPHWSQAGKPKISPPNLIISSISCCVFPPQRHLLGTLGIQNLLKTPLPNKKGKLHSEGRHSRYVPASGGPGARFPACGMQHGDQETAHPFPAAHRVLLTPHLHSLCPAPSLSASQVLIFIFKQPD